MSIKIETPPILSGEAESQLRQVYAYLYRLSEHLNLALHELDGSSAVVQSGGPNRSGTVDSSAGEGYGKTYNELRALIINTAETIREEMDKMTTTLNGSYTAISSQWGTFQENIKTTITATAREVVNDYSYDASIETLQQQAAGFEAYRLHTEGNIRQGFIDYDENGVPILGIAIGQGLTSVCKTINGVDYQQFSDTISCAFYTAEKVSFRIDGQEVAYLSNRRLYIGDMEVTGKVTLNDWLLTTAGGFTLKYIGGDG